jgi:hypothetical protein
MKTLRAVCALSAFVCVSAQAQDCSGGPGGGVDSTGNQCSTPATAVDTSYPVPAIARPAAAVAALMPVHATATGTRTVGTTSAAQMASASKPADRFPPTAKPPSEPAHTAKIRDAQDPSCSGGADGGIDATGNQCNSMDDIEGVVVARAHGR